MSYEIEYTVEAIRDLNQLKKRDQVLVVTAIDAQLRHTPAQVTRNRKPLRPNAIAAWELRIGDFRVLYNVEAIVRVVEIKRIGRKSGHRLVLGEQEVEP